MNIHEHEKAYSGIVFTETDPLINSRPPFPLRQQTQAGYYLSFFSLSLLSFLLSVWKVESLQAEVQTVHEGLLLPTPSWTLLAKGIQYILVHVLVNKVITTSDRTSE